MIKKCYGYSNKEIAQDPEIILADEPTGALDQKNGKEFMELLTKLKDEGKAIVIVTHDINIANYCDRIIEIKDGKIV